MKIIANLYYRNNIVDAQALTIRKKDGRAYPLEIHLDAAIDNTIGPDMIARAMKAAAKKHLTAAARDHHDTHPAPAEGASPK